MSHSSFDSKDRIAFECICCGSTSLHKSPAIVMPFIAKRIWGYEPVEISAEWGLRDIKQGVAYSLCNTVQCLNCEILFLDIRFTDHELSLLYRGYRNDSYVSMRNSYEPGYAERNKFFSGRAAYIKVIEEFLLKHIPLPRKILDWGGDSGINTPLLKLAQIIHVFDISGTLPIEGVSMVSRDEIENNNYDLIICSQVLEHIPYPKELLMDIASVMTRSTILYIEVPYEEIMRKFSDSSNLGERKRHWHEHINFFSLRSMEKLIESAGLELIELTTTEVTVASNSAVHINVLCRKTFL